MRTMIIIACMLVLCVGACTNPAAPQPVPDLTAVTYSISDCTVESFRVKYTDETGDLTDWMIVELPWLYTVDLEPGTIAEFTVKKVSHHGSLKASIYSNDVWVTDILEEPYGTLTLNLLVE